MKKLVFGAGLGILKLIFLSFWGAQIFFTIAEVLSNASVKSQKIIFKFKLCGIFQTLLKYVLSDPQRNAGTRPKKKKNFRFHVLLWGTIGTCTIFFIGKKPEYDAP